MRYRIHDVRLSQILGEDYFLDPERNYAEDTPLGVKLVVEDAPEDTKVYPEIEGVDVAVRGFFYTGIEGRINGRIVDPPIGAPFVVQYSLGKMTSRFPKVHRKRIITR